MILRYPGGKKKLSPVIVNALSGLYVPGMQYMEPFVGGGSIAVDFMHSHPFTPVWLNDLDVGIAALWRSVASNPNAIIAHVNRFTPSVKAFYDIKSFLLDGNLALSGLTDDEIAYVGFCKIAIHQISYSGLGTMSGGPLGGTDQVSKYPIDCRWSPKHIERQIWATHTLFSRVSYMVTNADFGAVIENAGNALIYLDPPYYIKGADLYQHSFTDGHHERLAGLLRFCSAPWLLSYDDAPRIRELYAWAYIREVDVGYSITALKSEDSAKRVARTKKELVISNREFGTYNQ